MKVPSKPTKAQGKGVTDNPKMGKKGNVRGAQVSSKGVQYPFMPASYDNGGRNRAPHKPGISQVSKRSKRFPFMPNSVSKTGA